MSVVKVMLRKHAYDIIRLIGNKAVHKLEPKPIMKAMKTGKGYILEDDGKVVGVILGHDEGEYGVIDFFYIEELYRRKPEVMEMYARVAVWIGDKKVYALSKDISTFKNTATEVDKNLYEIGYTKAKEFLEKWGK